MFKRSVFGIIGVRQCINEAIYVTDFFFMYTYSYLPDNKVTNCDWASFLSKFHCTYTVIIGMVKYIDYNLLLFNQCSIYSIVFGNYSVIYSRIL